MDQNITSKEPTSKTVDFTTFYDDLVEFNDYCAFFCDAVSSLFSEAMQSEPDMRTVVGLQRHCSDLKARARKLENKLVEPSLK